MPKHMNRLITALATLAISVAGVGVASASTSRDAMYILQKGHAKCSIDYVKRTQKIKGKRTVVCVYHDVVKAPKLVAADNTGNTGTSGNSGVLGNSGTVGNTGVVIPPPTTTTLPVGNSGVTGPTGPSETPPVVPAVAPMPSLTIVQTRIGVLGDPEMQWGFAVRINYSQLPPPLVNGSTYGTLTLDFSGVLAPYSGCTTTLQFGVLLTPVFCKTPDLNGGPVTAYLTPVPYQTAAGQAEVDPQPYTS